METTFGNNEENIFQEPPYQNETLITVRNWLKMQESRSLTPKDIRAYWRQHVPALYSLRPNCDCLNITYDEELAYKVLFLPLERFIVGSENEANPSAVLKNLKVHKGPSNLCGKVFKKAEPTYSCRDCGHDATCVLCIECFKNSHHKHHRYKMSTSGGGGYCDCGDVEAWAGNPFCSVHMPNPDDPKDGKDDVYDSLPESMISRMTVVLKTILPYSIQMLTWENSLHLPKDLQLNDSQSSEVDEYVTMMFNDEMHTYDQVMQSLTRAIDCTQKEAMEYATIVDREGRSSIKCGKFNVCESIERSIGRLTSRNSSGRPLRVSVMSNEIVAHQTFAMRLLQWLQTILGYAEAFRRIFSDILLGNELDGPPKTRRQSQIYGTSNSLLESVMSKDTQLWKAARKQWHHLFISVLLMDQDCKRAFSKIITRNYPSLISEFIADDHDHSLSITSLTVQVFTVPSVAHMLIEEDNAIHVIMSAFNEECEKKKKAETGKLSFERHEPSHSFRRSLLILHDVKYLLHAKPEKWNADLRKNFLLGLSATLKLFTMMQGMDSVTRQVGQHMEFEPEWENGFNLHMRLSSVISFMLRLSFRSFLRGLEACESGTIPYREKEVCGITARCIDYSVLTQPVSIHLPIIRFIAGLFLNLPKHNLNYNSEEFQSMEKPSPEYLLEFSLRTLITNEDCVKKEIIQMLCIEPMAHSELSRLLPSDDNNETGVESVITEIADFKKPQESMKGKYVLKSEYYEDFNPFFYHYSKEDQSKAEENQKKRKRSEGSKLCFPPPVPPDMTEAYSPLIHILDCDIMIHIMKTVLSRINENEASSMNENYFQKVLHLIGIALHEEAKQIEKNSSEFCFLQKAYDQQILSLLESLLTSQLANVHIELLKWTTKKFRDLISQKSCSSMDTEMIAVDDDAASLKSNENARDEEKAIKAKIAADRRAKIMEQITAQQKRFIQSHATHFNELAEIPSGSQTEDLSLDMDIYSNVALGLTSQMRPTPTKVFTCILCQEDQEVNVQNIAMVLTAFVQQSTVMSQSRNKTIIDPEVHDPLLLSANLFSAPHTKTCGHVMHATCYDVLYQNIVAKEKRPPLRFRHNLSFDISKHEFLCPLCETITNATIPLVPSLPNMVSKTKNPSSLISPLSFDEWLSALHITLQHKITVTIDCDDGKQMCTYKSPKMSSVLERLPPSVGQSLEQLFSLYKIAPRPELSSSFKDMMIAYCQSTYIIGLNVHPHLEDNRAPLMMWQSCAYTILSHEWVLRDQMKPLFGSCSSRQNDCLQTVVRFLFAFNLVIPAEILQSHCIRLLSWLLAQEDSYNNDSLSIIEVDMFTMFVSLTASTCALFQSSQHVPLPLGNLVDLYNLRLVYIAHVIQILLTSSFECSESAMDTEMTTKESIEEQNALEWYKFVRKAAGFPVCEENLPSGHIILNVIQNSTLPFLRCAALFLHYVTDVPTSEKLNEFGLENEHELLCHYIGISHNFSQLTHSVKLQALVERWMQHETIKNYLRGASSASIVQYPLNVTQLVKLPQDYSEVINSVSLFSCPKSEGDDSKMPAMCLVCGKVICSQSYCCQTELNDVMVGACTEHASTCGAGNSMFMRIRDCKLLVLSGVMKGCFIPLPYLDKYGETDIGLKRGNPLHLSEEKYKEIHSKWLNHDIPEAVSRTLEGASTILAIEWQNL
ncbi:E3 ubiquitin-protein ligase UBR2 [Nymphon striatum]|nr:E3 ubiquitin-protein ligase UBR2 [Nymphon striatum]